MIKNHTAQAGFTLVELITWMALSSLLLAAVGGIFFSSTKLWTYGNHQYDVQQSARLVVDTMTNELRYGNANKDEDIENTGFAPNPDYAAKKIQSIMFKSHKDGLTKTYYLDTTNNKLYYVEGAKSPVLVKGQTNNSRIIPVAGKEIFDIEKNSVNLNFMLVAMNDSKSAVTDADKTAEKSFIVQTTITLLDSFLK